MFSSLEKSASAYHLRKIARQLEEIVEQLKQGTGTAPDQIVATLVTLRDEVMREVESLEDGW